MQKPKFRDQCYGFNKIFVKNGVFDANYIYAIYAEKKKTANFVHEKLGTIA
jgi:hypothetical protein